MSTIEERINEAHDNFINGRYMNAARILQSPIQYLSETKEITDFLDAVYMTHFRLVSLFRAENNLELVSTLVNCSKSMLEFAAKISMKNVQSEELDFPTKIQFMKITRKIFQNLRMDEEEESLRMSLISAFLDRIDDVEKNKKIEYYRETLELMKKDDSRKSVVVSKLVELLNENAELLNNYNKRERESGGFVKDVEESQIYLNIASIYRKEDKEKMKEYLRKAFESSNVKLFNKFNFPQFTSIDEIDNYQ